MLKLSSEEETALLENLTILALTAHVEILAFLYGVLKACARFPYFLSLKRLCCQFSQYSLSDYR